MTQGKFWKNLLFHPLFWVTAGAFLWRLAGILSSPIVLTEGTTYVTIVANLLAERGYVGILGTVEPFAPPLYPLLIAVFAWLLHDGVLSARLISLLAGTALVSAVYFLAALLFDKRIGRWAALLIAFAPLLVEYSTLEWSETLYALLLVLGLAFGWRTRQTRGWKNALLAGVCFGLAYLTRVEGALGVLVVATWLLLQKPAAWRNALFLGVAFVILAAPYTIWLSTTLDRVALESKSNINFVIAERMANGLSYVDAAYGLNANGEPEGPFLERTRELQSAPTSRTFSFSPARIQLLLGGLRDVLDELLNRLASPLVLAVFAVGIGSIFFLRRQRNWRVAALFLGSFLALSLLTVGLVPQVYTRYLLPVLPLILIFVAVGIATGADLFQKLTRAGNRFHLDTIFGIVFACALLLSLPRASSVTARRVSDVDQQRAGAWLAAQNQNHALRILSVHSQIPFYAHGIHVPMPNGLPEQVLTYAEKMGVDVIVTSPRKLAGRPKLAPWRDGQSLSLPWRVVYRDDAADGGPLILWERN